jgi:Holliday junction resolvasome RuvABC endonuclease subunit
MSLAHAGVCVDGHIATAVFPPSDKRFGSIFQWVTAELKRVEPGVMVIEGGAFGGHNLFDLGQASGSAIAAALNLGWAFVEVAPASLKRWATGHGHAPKELMGAAAVGRRGAPMPGSTRARREDAADAYLLWAWGVEHLE